MVLSALISTAVKILIGWILIDKVPSWLNLRGIIATIIKVIREFGIIQFQKSVICADFSTCTGRASGLFSKKE